MRKAYILYLWLSLFTLFISIFSIILFNYTSGDIKITRKLIQETNYQGILRSISIVATELYRRGKYSGDYVFKGNRYSFSSTRISPTKLLIQISHNNQLVARVIVMDRKYISNLSVYFADTPNGDDTTISEETSYSTFATTSDSISIQADEKIFKYAYITPETAVNGQRMTHKGGEVHFYNLQELGKYAEVANLIPKNLDGILLRNYKYLANFLGDKSMNSRTYSDEPVDLTKYGSVYISTHPNKRLKDVYLNFRQENNNQIVGITVNYRDEDSGNILNPPNIQYDYYEYYIIRYPQTLSVIPSTTVTNDQYIENQISDRGSSTKTINLTPTYPYVYKVLIKYDQDSKPLRSIIYKTSYSKTMIYSNAGTNLFIGSNSPDTFMGGVVGDIILLVVKNDVIVKGNIAYREFNSIMDFVNFAENQQSTTFPANSRSYLSVIAKNITIDSSGFGEDKNMILCGDYAAFYDTTSTLNLTNPNIRKLYYFGSTISYHRYKPEQEEIIFDTRESENLLKIQFSTCKIIATEILK